MVEKNSWPQIPTTAGWLIGLPVAVSARIRVIRKLAPSGWLELKAVPGCWKEFFSALPQTIPASFRRLPSHGPDAHRPRRTGSGNWRNIMKAGTLAGEVSLFISPPQRVFPAWQPAAAALNER